MVKGVNPPDLWRAGDGKTISQGHVRPKGQTVQLTGQVAWDIDHHVVGPGDAQAQTEKCIDNVEAVLASFGGRLEDIVSLTIYFVNRKDLQGIRDVRARRLYFSEGTAPVSILIQVSGSVLPEFLIEIVPIAVIPDERFMAPR